MTIVSNQLLNDYFRQNWFTNARIHLVNDSAPEQGYRWDLYNQERDYWWKNSLNLAVITIIAAVLALFMNIYVSIQLLKQKLDASKTPGRSQTISKQDLKFFIFNIFIFFNQIANFVIQASFSKGNNISAF